ncbi:SnoaL-like protein [Actinocorallia herbida]|uniref:SnoaL-like protein n=2 Tax=Actinocorallia herbida TaxID=58109 RepID=A0A3N1CSM4_9ACTN|nr:SnoaL-like protein [Actinocorallia herbida]
MDQQELSARELIRDAFTRYAAAGDGGRPADLAAQFTEDGVLTIKPDPPLVGRAAITAALAPGEIGVPTDGSRFYTRHMVTNLDFRIFTPDQVETTAYFLVITPGGPDHWGRYFDVLVPVGDRWLFASRTVVIDGDRPGGWRAAGRGAR